MPKKLSSSDRNASRTAMPGSKRQVPADTTTVRTARGTPVGKVEMNYGGVAGGNPTGSKSVLQQREKSFKQQGATDSAKAAKDRADNLAGHDRMTMAAKSRISMEKSFARLKEYKTTARRPK